MGKTFKKSDINKYLNEKNSNKQNLVNELVGTNGALINRTNNYKQNRNHIKSKKTTDDYVRSSTQGPEAYFIYGGPYYGVNYSYIVNEEEEILDTDINDFYEKLDVKPSKNYDTYMEYNLKEGEDSMKSLVDEIIRKKKDVSKDFVKKMRENEIMVDKVIIPDITELKDIHEKPIVIRKINSLLDLIHKENITGNELSILLNHLIDNLDIYTISEEHREIIGDKIKYGEQEEK
jgi:hypothetical protein